MRKHRIGLASCTGLLIAMFLIVAPAEASTKIEIVNGGSPSSFSPQSQVGSPGASFHWHNGSSLTHRSRRNSFIGWWTSNIAPGATSSNITLTYSGTYSYFCSIHPDMKGSIGIRPSISPSSGTTATTFTITVATVSAPSGDVYDIQIKKPGAGWAAWHTQTAKSATYRPRSRGTYSFRARIRKTSNGATVAYSPTRSFTV